MTQDRVDALNAAHFIWDPPSYSWHERFSQVQMMVEQYGSLEAIPHNQPFERQSSAKGESILVHAWIKVRPNSDNGKTTSCSISSSTLIQHNLVSPNETRSYSESNTRLTSEGAYLA